MVLRFIPPQLPTLVDAPPAGDGWIHEIKQDGYRTQLIVEDGRARVMTRNGLDWSDKLWPIRDAAAALPVRAAIIDGELIVQDAAGVSDFAALSLAIARTPERLVLFGFDLLHLDGEDLRGRALEERRGTLADLLDDSDRRVLAMSEAIEGDGPTIFSAAEALGVEGIVSKRKGSTYRSGSSRTWLKAKYFRMGEFEVVGVDTTDGGAPSALLAERRADGLHYVGRAFITVPAAACDAFWAYVEANAVPTPAARGLGRQRARWLRPGLVADVRYLRGEGILRHATLTGIRVAAAAI